MFCPSLEELSNVLNPLQPIPDAKNLVGEFNGETLQAAKKELEWLLAPMFKHTGGQNAFKIETYQRSHDALGCQAEIEMNTFSGGEFKKVFTIKFPGGYKLIVLIKHQIEIPLSFHADLMLFITEDPKFKVITDAASWPFNKKLECGSRLECPTNKHTLVYRISLHRRTK